MQMAIDQSIEKLMVDLEYSLVLYYNKQLGQV
jgi:hypothetical protein